MKISIIGTGNIGGALTRRFTQLHHDVRIANSRGPESLRELASETGALPSTVQEVVQGADVIVVTIPEKNIPNLPGDLFAQVPADTAVIDTGNYYPRQRDGKISEIEEGLSESRWVEQHLGHAVIKVFNNIYAKHLLERGLPAGEPGRIALPVAGDDVSAKQKVMGLVEELGFDAVDAGGLDESWRQQPGSPCYGADSDVEGLREALRAASPHRTSDWRA
ncbi:NADPH-dependent F420 reductase [Alicyclobacillus sp. SO9]|nr:NADPH-dependent F420 reductase [Alicyclobacillus sp. SO9]